MAAQEIKTMPVCVCGNRTDLAVTPNGWYTVKCPSCGIASEEQDTVNNAVGSFLTKIYKTPLACFIGCLAHELRQFSNEDIVREAIEAASSNDYDAVRRIAKAELDKLNINN